MKKSLLGLAVVSALSASFTATAEDMYRGAWYAVPGVSILWDDKRIKADDADAGPMLAIGKELSPSWDVQGRISYNELDANNSISKGITGGDYEASSISLDALYMFRRDNFRPFLLAGLGWANNKVDYQTGFTKKERNSFMAELGLGAQVLFNDKFGLQGALRHQWSKARATNGTMDVNDTIGNALLDLGVMYRFGAPAPVVAPAPEPEPMPVAPAPEPEPVCTPTVETISLSSEKLFGFNKAGLNDTSDIDTQVVEKMKNSPMFAQVKIIGHTDKIGSAAYNQKLSEKRARMVRDYIISKGIEPSRLVAVGMGENQPKVNCDGVKGRKALIQCLAPNRRVEVQATGTVEKGCN